MRFTKPSIDRLAIPSGRDELLLFDEALPGFGIRLRAGGKRTWIVQYRIGAKQRRLTIGRVDVLDLDKARVEAKKALAMVGLARDPVAERAKARAEAAITFGALLPLYLEAKKEELRPRSYVETERHLRRDFAPLHGLPLSAIDRAMVAARLTELKKRGASAADHARRALSAFFAWAMKEGAAENNPVLATHRPAEPKARERVLTDAELAEIWNGCRDDDYGRIVRLLAVTGQRREEVGSMRRSEIDRGRAIWSLPGDRTKNGRPHEVPLSDPAFDLLAGVLEREGRDLIFGQGEGGFSGWSRAKAALDARINGARKKHAPKAKPIERWTLHDLRRTMATRLGDLGVQPHVVEAILNHVSGPSRAGVAGIYNRALYSAEKRSSLILWAEHVIALVSGSDAKVVALWTAEAATA